MEVTDEGVPLGSLIEAVKASVKRAGISRTSQTRDLQVASVQLIIEAIASETAGGGLDLRVPFIGMRLKLGAKVTKKDTHTIDMTLVPPEDAGRAVRGGEDVEEALVNAITAIRTVASRAEEGDDPWILSESVVDLAFAVTQTGTISLGVDGELSDELTHTLRLRLAPAKLQRAKEPILADVVVLRRHADAQIRPSRTGLGYSQLTVVAEAVAMPGSPATTPEQAKDIAFTAEVKFRLPDIPDPCCCAGPAREETGCVTADPSPPPCNPLP